MTHTATLLCCHFFLVKAVNWMQNSLYKLFEHKCVLEVCVHIHPIMIKTLKGTSSITKTSSDWRYHDANATLLCCHFFLVKAVNWMQNSLYKLFEHKCVLEVCVHIHPIMIKIHPVFFFKSPLSNQAILRFLSEWRSSVQLSAIKVFSCWM